ncbi:MAG: 3-hydroxyacyl-CoA dehydrogenase NAD-binding domain-containing protein [Bdellovibrionales bacterium]
MSMQHSLKIAPRNLEGVGSVAYLEFDLAGEKVNKLSTPVMLRLREALQEVARGSYKAAVFVSRKPKIFIAGADIDEIRALDSKEKFSTAVAQGQDIFNMIEDLPIPTFAAIHGACAGGGCELILACDYRICTEDSSTRIGLPETQLGILPGFGGCVRLPRVVGLQAALDVILAGKLVNAKKAQKMGLVDRMVHPNLLEEQTALYIQEIIKNGGQKRRKTFQAKGVVGKLLEGPLKGVVFSQAKKQVLKTTHGHYPSPLKALEIIRRTYGMGDRQKALTIEREGFCEVAVTDISKNLIHVFDLTELVKKQNGVPGVQVTPRDVKTLGILGAGTMGGGIAYVAADKGIRVRLKDLNPEALGKGYKHAFDLWAKLVKRKTIDKYQYAQKVNLISGGTDYADFRNMDVVVEAIVEDMGIKQKVIGETANNMRPDAIIVTNTSSLSVTEMSKGHPRPEYFAGMHFFNPVHRMPLVEVIRGSKTSDETIATIYELSKKMGKMPVVVEDGPGFLVNRLLLPYMAEAAFLLQEGMDINVVDRAYVKEFGMPMGPFALMDEVGLDVCIKVLKIFKKAFGDRVEMAPCMEALEKSGRLGKKNRKGFYLYGEDEKRGEVDPAIYSALGLNAPTNPLSKEECLERGVFAMVNECARALHDDKIVKTPHEVDLAMIMGTGFPPFRGGLLKYADKITPAYVVKQLTKYAGERNAQKRLSPSEALKRTTKFYS